MVDDLQRTTQAPAITRRHMLMGGAMVAASALAYARQPISSIPALPKGALEKMIPSTIGSWQFQTSSGLVLPPPDALSDRLYDEIVTRVYESQSAPPIMMLIAYSNMQDGLLQLHRPEICYPVGGFELSETKILPLQVERGLNIPSRFFSATSSARTEQVLYWTRIGSKIPTRWFDQRVAVMEANLEGNIPDGILVRLSTLLPGTEEAMAPLQNFTSGLAAALGRPARKLLFGVA